MRSESIRTTGRKRVPELGVSSSDNSDGDAVLVQRGTLRTAAPLTSRCFPIPADPPIRERFTPFPPSQPGSHFGTSGRNRSTQSSLPAGRSDARSLRYVRSSSGGNPERSLDTGTTPRDQAGKLGLRAFNPYSNVSIQHNIHTPQETPQLIPKPDPVAGVHPRSLVLQQALPQQPPASYATRPVKRRPAPPFPTPETIFKSLPPPLDLSFLASGRNQPARLSLPSGPHTAHLSNYGQRSPWEDSISSSQNGPPRDGRHQLSQANHGPRQEPEVSPTTLSSTLNELVHLSIPPSRLTILDSSEVGCGKYGEVLLAVLDGSSQTSTYVAVKQLRTVGTRGVRLRLALRLARELKIWAKAEHPHVLKLLGYYLSENYETAQFISPFMPNGNVSQYLDGKQIGALKRLEIIRDITLGMNYLHGYHPPICHGDLKPTNILINDSLNAVLCDFGLASFIQESGISSGLTTSQSIKGSIRYMSPELHLEEDAKHTLASDVWAWGCTAFEVLTDCAPYDTAKGDSGILMAFLRKDPPGSAETVMRGLSDDIPKDVIPTLHALKIYLSKCWDFVASGRPHMPTILLQLFPNSTAGGPGGDPDSIPGLHSFSVDACSPTSPTSYRPIAHDPVVSANTPSNQSKHFTRLMKTFKSFRLHQRLPGGWGTRVRGLEVSPDGERLMTRSEDSTACIWAFSTASAQFLLQRIIPKACQALWSNRGNVLLTLPSTATATIHREPPAKDSLVKFPQSQLKSAVYWMPREQTLASFHQTSVYIMNLKGAIIESHDFACEIIWDLAVTNDEQRMILAVKARQDRKGKDQGCIIVYNLIQRKVECRVPITNKVQKLTPSRNTGDAVLMLISYEGDAFPELWQMTALRVESQDLVRFQLVKIYGPLDGMVLVGPARFGGTRDEVVISAEKAGNVHIWNRDTSALVYSFKGEILLGVVQQPSSREITAIAWSSATPTRHMLVFATGDGVVNTWIAG